MADTQSKTAGDDAPLTASKHSSAAVDAATDGLVEARGDALVGRAVTINRPRAELYAYFRDFANLPNFMDNIERVDVQDATRSHWVVKAPAGRTVEWDSTITDEVEGEYFVWASEPGADIANSGRIEFRDAGARGTVVTATLLYDPPGGVVGKLIAKLFQREPAIQARRDLRRFKQLMETGEVATAASTRAQFEEDHK
ncbi:SRPBCC family protein [Sphingomonas glacialis]|uniref:SRPBCC family protein n=1 Tax=Sphingomonas glacialis TaxID=658225 RepID=A0A502FV37_9SPHN|nr:SRPBCC family protein [Sphingomonas glacialis]TPG52966.1 SRPBCC family protein [Sphingomonas glacialis]